MNAHEQIADDLALYALGTLEGAERTAVEKHLRECSACRSELERLRGDAAVLAFSASGARPPARSRERLLAAVAREARRPPAPAARKWPWWGALQWAAAAAVLAVFFLFVRQNDDLKQRVNQLATSSASQQQQLLQAKQLITALSAADADHFVLVASKTPPQPQGRAIYLAKSGTLVFLASNMPALPPEKIYELWLIPTSGAPIPAGLFRPNAEGSGSVVKPPLPVGVEAKTFAITVEPKEGSSAPTSQPIMLGTRG
ncbi:MAG TPA: anti-sigma factor [Candidatus Bathyarchaeia archaeon]|nr:anti-sigma factor [Candidatus Bathyarchaeia archaeon]